MSNNETNKEIYTKYELAININGNNIDNIADIMREGYGIDAETQSLMGYAFTLNYKDNNHNIESLYDTEMGRVVSIKIDDHDLWLETYDCSTILFANEDIVIEEQEEFDRLEDIYNYIISQKEPFDPELYEHLWEEGKLFDTIGGGKDGGQDEQDEDLTFDFEEDYEQDEEDFEI